MRGLFRRVSSVRMQTFKQPVFFVNVRPKLHDRDGLRRLCKEATDSLRHQSNPWLIFDRFAPSVRAEEFVTDSSGNLIVDFIGRSETLQQDFDLVCQRLGIEPARLPYVNHR